MPRTRQTARRSGPFPVPSQPPIAIPRLVTVSIDGGYVSSGSESELDSGDASGSENSSDERSTDSEEERSLIEVEDLLREDVDDDGSIAQDTSIADEGLVVNQEDVLEIETTTVVNLDPEQVGAGETQHATLYLDVEPTVTEPNATDHPIEVEHDFDDNVSVAGGAITGTHEVWTPIVFQGYATDVGPDGYWSYMYWVPELNAEDNVIILPQE
ncbi:hypothetical protein BV25DRAFT_1922654 [Artomyces pyxidatus]|uniref:Uncharacterized protein n=1 Tax=Artomyces pyxidatus TaxID=48021 RepID=A0ACB8SE14_9AGAM|nr:hypothetical protein BV25DRAFT_1922654 [Artomyces pyxidatus]